MTTRVLLVFLIVCFGLRVAAAQDGSGLAKSGMFGGGSESPSRDRLDITAALSEGLDSEVPLELRSRLQQDDPQGSGYSSMLLATVSYNRKRPRADVSGNLVTSLRHFAGSGQTSAFSSSAGLGATLPLGRRSSLAVNQTAAYSPSYLYRLFPAVSPPEVGDALPAAPDYRVDQTSSYSRATTIGIAVGSERTTRLNFEAQHEETDFRDVAQQDLDILIGRGKWSRGVGRTGGVSAEFEYRQGEFGYGARTTEKRLRIGAEYSPALSVSRRAQVRFSVAPSALEIPATAMNAVATGTLYKLEGDASVTYPFLFNWSIGGSYRRGVEYVAVLRTPVFSDATRFELAGLISQRLDVSASVGYLSGQSVLTQDSQPFDTYIGTTRARYAVTRSLALYGEYLHYYYDLRGSAIVAPTIPRVFKQHGIRVGVMLWARPVGR